MAQYEINKGVGRQVEFLGLRAQYLFLFAVGLLVVFILFMVMYMSGLPSGVCIVIGLLSGTALVWTTFRLNSRYGAHGLMKAAAAKYHPRRIIHRRSIRRLIHKPNRRL